MDKNRESTVRTGSSLKNGLKSILLATTLGFVTPVPAPTFMAGDLAPYGNQDGVLSVGDIVVLHRFLTDDLQPTANEQLFADVAPLGNPDGIINLGDLLILTRAVLEGLDLGTVVPPPLLNLITVDYVGGGQITVSGSAGAVSGGFQVKITTSTGYVETVTANADGSFSATFASGGATSMSIEVVDDIGVPSTSVSRGIGNATEEGINTQVLAVWNGFSAALNNGDAASATNYFSLITKDKYQELLSAIGSSITDLPTYWSSATPITLEDDYAEYAITQTVNGQERLHLIGFVRDGNGQWLIEQF